MRRCRSLNDAVDERSLRDALATVANRIDPPFDWSFSFFAGRRGKGAHYQGLAEGAAVIGETITIWTCSLSIFAGTCCPSPTILPVLFGSHVALLQPARPRGLAGLAEIPQEESPSWEAYPRELQPSDSLLELREEL